MRVPCRDCKLRKIGCFSHCKSYLAYKEELSKAKVKKEYDSLYLSYQMELRNRRAKKRK